VVVRSYSITPFESQGRQRRLAADLAWTNLRRPQEKIAAGRLAPTFSAIYGRIERYCSSGNGGASPEREYTQYRAFPGTS